MPEFLPRSKAALGLALTSWLVAAALPAYGQPPAKSANEPTKKQLALIKQCESWERWFEQHGFVIHDAGLSAYLKRVARPLVPDSPSYLAWQFQTLRDPLVLAFSLPNGAVYVSSGMLARLENDDQLAGVLAHEIGHVMSGDLFPVTRREEKKAVARAIGAGLVGSVPIVGPAVEEAVFTGSGG
ncbi:MAG TPA: M48 family metallopeptidase, partial [Bryobacteraceae bacterium]|nr:M48 family metallopeptidase [Bryobacteraceae bacterium]